MVFTDKKLLKISAEDDMNYLQDVYLSNLNAVSNMGGFFSLPAKQSWQKKVHSFNQNKFYFITKGICEIVIDGKKYTAKAGDWFFIPANSLHSYENDDKMLFQKYWMHFDIFPNNELFNILNLPHYVKVEKGSRVYTLFKKYSKLSSSDILLDKLKVKAILLELLSEYIDHAITDTISVKSITDSKIDEVLRYINNNIEKSLSLNELSLKFHMHPNHFIRFFKSKTGQTPAKYVKEKKMETAKCYLESTELYINEIMEKIGEDDPASFSKQFKSVYSYSPREYRKICKK